MRLLGGRGRRASNSTHLHYIAPADVVRAALSAGDEPYLVALRPTPNAPSDLWSEGLMWPALGAVLVGPKLWAARAEPGRVLGILGAMAAVLYAIGTD